jgi:hypothetical protein
LEVTQ